MANKKATKRLRRTKVQAADTKSKRPFIKGLIIFVSILFLLIFAASTGLLFMHRQTFFKESPQQPASKEVVIKPGASLSAIAEQLEKEGIVSNDITFKIYLRIQQAEGIQAGSYTLKVGDSYTNILKTLEAGASEVTKNKLTIPEGSDIDTIAVLTSKVTSYSAEDFMKKVQDKTFLDQLTKKYPELLKETMASKNVRYHLEGYLYPATYNLSGEETLDTIIENMVSEMAKYVKSKEKEIKQSNLSLHELLTLASLIEAEAGNEEDRALISGVFYNRLKDDMPLQSDISILYALKKHTAYVTIADTQVDSPYNLYEHTGLGPGPFGSPSANSIEAALNPQASDYLYFVADLKTGKVYYSKSYEEHQALVDKYVSAEAAQEVSEPK